MSMGLNSAATGGSGTFSGLSRCTEADLMTANEAVAGRCGPGAAGEEGEAQPCVWAAGAVPALAIPNRSGKKL